MEIEECEFCQRYGSGACTSCGNRGQDPCANVRTAVVKTTHVVDIDMPAWQHASALEAIGDWCGPGETVVVREDGLGLTWRTNWPDQDPNGWQRIAYFLSRVVRAPSFRVVATDAP